MNWFPTRLKFPTLAVSVVIGLIAAAALAAYQPRRPVAAACRPPHGDSAWIARRAEDTIYKIRRAHQHAISEALGSTGYTVRTEDTSRVAIHTGGQVSFDCAGRVSEVWLDGG